MKRKKRGDDEEEMGPKKSVEIVKSTLFYFLLCSHTYTIVST